MIRLGVKIHSNEVIEMLGDSIERTNELLEELLVVTKFTTRVLVIMNVVNVATLIAIVWLVI
tara:strand:- start:335 stop:520 length:186 start_codon:yes stop_codon:yes gene_type:complete